MKKNLHSILISTAFLVTPMLSQADYCAEVKERYWKCVRSSMVNEKCDDADNMSIPAECLSGASSAPQNNGTSSTSKSKWDFLETKKEVSTPVESEPNSPAKPVKVINIKPLNNKRYIETEEDVNQFITNLKTELLNSLEEGKKVRLQYQ